MVQHKKKNFLKQESNIKNDENHIDTKDELGDLDINPYKQFARWYQDALNASLLEPTAMTLATVNANGIPSARVVLLKSFDDRGFVFFTNYQSRKGDDLNNNPLAALVFWWDKLSRQIRIEGRVSKISSRESDIYFASRPRLSQISAWVSKQSQIIPNREYLDSRFNKLLKDFEGVSISRPEYWGGYRVMPEKIEFWQGRSNRLHDRFRYLRIGEGEWEIARLSP